MYTEKEIDIGRDGNIQRNRDRGGRRQRMMEQKGQLIQSAKKLGKKMIIILKIEMMKTQSQRLFAI